MKNNFTKNKGFTLIELLVVVAIIGILSSVVLSSLTSARDKAKYTSAKVDIDQLKKSMFMFKIDKGELPPLGDLCSACSNPPNSTWTLTVDALVNGGYLSGRIDKDPWGNYYGYDDNDCNSGQNSASYVFTAGSDKISLTADDYRVTITNSCTD
jgi:general secretion pathway protein G